MTYTFYAEDNEFAAATGSNVNYDTNVSRFDYPPTSSKDLIITSHEGDSDPRLFEVGETYTVSFSGNGGATIQNATVIRSDYTTADDGTAIEGNEGAIVFEGLDENGELVQVVWSPNFDLETWYFDNFNEGNSPGFYTEDVNSGQTVQFACFTAGTLITVSNGQKRIEELQPGDLVETKDHGPVALAWCAHSRVPGLGRGAPITIAPALFGGHAPLTVSPQHRMLVRDPFFQLAFGTPEILIAAKHLVDGEMVTARSCSMVSYHHLLCERHEVLIANGMETESLLLGDQVQGVMSKDALERFKREAKADWYSLRHAKTARYVVKASEASLVKRALGLNARDISSVAPAMLCAA